MGKGNLNNKKPCPICGKNKKYKFCCRDLNLFKKDKNSFFNFIERRGDDSIKNKKNGEILEPYLSGDEAEIFINNISKKTFLKPWVFKNPKYEDGKEFTDVAILFRDSLVLIEVKGNQFDPKNPQRYLSQAKRRHKQLINAERIAKNHSKNVEFKNDYFSFKTNFNDINKIYLISVSAGLGELELSCGTNCIDHSKIDYKDRCRYLGFFDSETNIHSFTIKEMEFAGVHIDTIQDFFWYLDFEKKFLNNNFKEHKDGQKIIAVVDENREDMIAVYLLNYYWDEDLNNTGQIDLNKILNSDKDAESADVVAYFASGTSKNLERDNRYKDIQKEREVSYFWDNLIENNLSKINYSYKLVGENGEKEAIGTTELRDLLEEMSFASRLERVAFSERIKEAEERGIKLTIFCSMRNNFNTIFSYARFDYEKFPNQDMQEKSNNEHLYKTWCRVKFGEKFIPVKDRLEKVVLITNHSHGGKHTLSFSLSSGIEVDEGVCRNIGAV